MHKLLVFMIALSFSLLSYGKRFANGYTEFELPHGWKCIIEGSEWVCQSENADRKKEAIIILAAKKAGPQDTLDAYQAYLKQTKTYQLPGANLQRSEPKNVKLSTINGHRWVDALHLASEVPGFYTRYLATVKADIGVAVTFSVTKSLYSAYKGVFDNIIKSLRVIRSAPTTAQGNFQRGKEENFEDGTFAPVEEDLSGAVIPTQTVKSDSSSDSSDLMILLVIAAVVVVILLKLRKKPKKKKKKKVKKE